MRNLERFPDWQLHGRRGSAGGQREDEVLAKVWLALRKFPEAWEAVAKEFKDKNDDMA